MKLSKRSLLASLMQHILLTNLHKRNKGYKNQNHSRQPTRYQECFAQYSFVMSPPPHNPQLHNCHPNDIELELLVLFYGKFSKLIVSAVFGAYQVGT